MELDFKIYFINLKDRINRWDDFLSYSKFYPDYIRGCIERVEAFDSRSNIDFLEDLGLKLDPVSIPSVLYFSQSKGAVGCYASHYYCWEKIISDNVERALILEDDIDPSDVFRFLQSNPDIDENIDLHHLGKRDFDGLEAYILNKSGANKLISLTKEPFHLEDKVDIPLGGNFSNQDPLSYEFFKNNLDYSFEGKLDCITSAVDKFVGYSTSQALPTELKVTHKFIPCISLSQFAYNSSDIEGDNFGNLFNNMTEFEINDLVSSDKIGRAHV